MNDWNAGKHMCTSGIKERVWRRKIVVSALTRRVWEVYVGDSLSFFLFFSFFILIYLLSLILF